MPKTCPTCNGSRRVRRIVSRAWWQVLLRLPATLDELCVDCSGIGVVKGSPEEEQEFEQGRQRNREELEHKKAAPATASFGEQPEAADSKSDKHGEVVRLVEELMYKANKIGPAKKLMKLGSAATEQLLLALRNGDDGARTFAAVALGQIGDLRAVDWLIAATEDRYWDVRSQAARALGKIGDVRAMEALRRALANEGVVVSGPKHIVANRLTGERRVVNDMSDTVKSNIRAAISALERGDRIPLDFRD